MTRKKKHPFPNSQASLTLGGEAATIELALEDDASSATTAAAAYERFFTDGVADLSATSADYDGAELRATKRRTLSLLRQYCPDHPIQRRGLFLR